MSARSRFTEWPEEDYGYDLREETSVVMQAEL
jgi:hypothetical protein